MRLGYRTAILFSGLLWLMIGILLLTKGINYLVLAGNAHLSGGASGFSLLKCIDFFAKSSEQSATILVCVALVLGFFKGRVVMKKAVIRVVRRIRSLPAPIPLTALYSKGYLFLIGGMALLGIAFKYLPLPMDIKGFVDFAVGVALINGAMLYVRAIYDKELCS